MNKKQEFLHNEQSRDKHLDRVQVGSPAIAADAGDKPAADQQEARQGKVSNDHNKVGEQAPTQLNQGRRTPESRNDRQTLGPGSQNQVSARKGGGGAGRGPRGAG